GVGARPPLVAGERPARVPLSLAQQRMWVLNQFDPDSPAYNIPMAIRLQGALDVPALRRAVEDVLTRHEVLRTRYPESAPGAPAYQEILSVAEVLPHGLEVERARDIGARVGELVFTGFDVAQRVPVRVRLITGDDPDDYLLVLVAHHISADGASMAPLARDLMTAYLARTAGQDLNWTPLAVQYADFAVWQRAVVGVDSDENSPAARQLEFWREQLAALPTGPLLPTDRPRTAASSMAGAFLDFSLPAEVHTGLNRIARQHNASLFMVVHAAVAAWLARLSGNGDVVIGTAVAGRGERALDDLVGMFVNTLTLRTAVDIAAPFDTLVAQARETDLNAFANADVPFERVSEVAAAGRTAANPLLQVVLSLQNTETPVLELPGLRVSAIDTELAAAKFDLQISMEPRPGVDGALGALDVIFGYATDLFDEATVEAFGRVLERILTAVAADPHIAVADIALLDQPEPDVAQQVSADAEPGLAATRGAALTQVLTTAVEDDPDGPALVWGDEAVTYQELDARSSRLARVLIAHGSGPGAGVLVHLERGVEQAVATWAVLKAGAMLVPLAAAAAPGLDVKVGVTSGSAPATAVGIEWLVLDDPEVVAQISAESKRPVTYASRTRALRGDDAAYIAGGAVLTYDGLAAAVDRVRTGAELTFESRTFHSGAADAALALVELVSAGVVGASVVLADSSSVLSEALSEEWVTHLFAEPAGIADLGAETPDDLQAVILPATARIEDSENVITLVIPGIPAVHQ
ncbi:condensation domain-containing protein, partial [Nocardia acidivorans]|uniref:condensation domain-containing protein n=1 Tax=Nocardia acidivorans TaxID=404580 RepID=UPI000B2AAA6E